MELLERNGWVLSSDDDGRYRACNLIWQRNRQETSAFAEKAKGLRRLGQVEKASPWFKNGEKLLAFSCVSLRHHLEAHLHHVTPFGLLTRNTLVDDLADVSFRQRPIACIAATQNCDNASEHLRAFSAPPLRSKKQSYRSGNHPP